jgi:L-methionine (R)-S-oxide reductase
MTPANLSQSWLQAFISEHAGIAGTVHVLTGEQLCLDAAVNIPPPVIAVTRQIPKGKGMAGLAWERGTPVQTCNLQTDTSGDVRPGAKAINAQAAAAIPVKDAQGALRAVVGIAFADDRELSADELARLVVAASALPA